MLGAVEVRGARCGAPGRGAMDAAITFLALGSSAPFQLTALWSPPSLHDASLVFIPLRAQRPARARVGGAAADVRVRGSACLCGMAAITMADFLNGCSQFRTTLSHASHKVVREWDGEALKNAFGWADYIEQVTRAQRRAPVRLPAHTPRCAPHRR